METLQTGLVVLIIFIAAFYLLKLGLEKKDNSEGGCNSCSENCGACRNQCSESGQSEIFLSKDDVDSSK